jgi:hypothetical protein
MYARRFFSDAACPTIFLKSESVNTKCQLARILAQWLDRRTTPKQNLCCPYFRQMKIQRAI